MGLPEMGREKGTLERDPAGMSDAALPKKKGICHNSHCLGSLR